MHRDQVGADHHICEFVSEFVDGRARSNDAQPLALQLLDDVARLAYFARHFVAPVRGGDLAVLVPFVLAGDVGGSEPDAFLSVKADAGSTAGIYVQVAFRNTSNGAPVGSSPEIAWTTLTGFGGFVRKSSVITAPAPTNGSTVRAYFTAYAYGRAGGGIRNIKIENGAVATLYTDDASTGDIYASVTQQLLAIVDLENQQALAYFSQVAAASGGLPAFVELLSSTLGGRAAIAGPVVALLNTIAGGDPLVALQAIGGEVFFKRPIYIDLGTKRLIVGPGNGWVMWFGGQDKTAATATRTNGSFSLGDDGQVYLGAAALAPGSPFTASAPTARVKTQVGGTGAITTTAVPIAVSGATGTVTYTWSPVFGEVVAMTCSNTASASPTFSATIAGVGRVQTIWAWTATDSGTGTTRAGQTYVTIQRDA